MSPRVQAAIDVFTLMPEIFNTDDEIEQFGDMIAELNPTPEEASALTEWAREQRPGCDLPLDVSRLDSGDKYVSIASRLEDYL